MNFTNSKIVVINNEPWALTKIDDIYEYSRETGNYFSDYWCQHCKYIGEKFDKNLNKIVYALPYNYRQYIKENNL